MKQNRRPIGTGSQHLTESCLYLPAWSKLTNRRRKEKWPVALMLSQSWQHPKMCIASTFLVSLLPYNLFINLRFHLFIRLNISIPLGFSSLILRPPVTKQSNHSVLVHSQVMTNTINWIIYKQQKCISLQFWDWKVQEEQDAGRSCLVGFTSWFMDDSFPPCPHMVEGLRGNSLRPL